ncbi:hypothetical protein MUP77_23805 [Candidatus Bathyarchaeota archaeon]|nr:hypothetical protein [Candidatus Bathyarchaeota archaeon]
MSESERKDNFEKGIFWELYQDLERQFSDFLEYIPYLEGNENAYSFRLLNLILNIGGYVDSAFKEMARYPKFNENVGCQEIMGKIKESEQRKKEGKGPIPVSIELPLKTFETEYKLSQRAVVFKRLPKGELVLPFKPHNAKTGAPRWWDVYNGLKHDVSLEIKKANLRNARDALAGAFLLNVIHEPSVLRLHDNGFLKFTPQHIEGETAGPFEYSLMVVPRHMLVDMLNRRQNFSGYVKTPLFLFDYEQEEGVKP